MPATDPIRDVAREVFGYQDLRPGQPEAIGAVVEGRDALAVLPTGAGKSAIYAIAGHLLGGPTVVVSPLLSLQHDQIAALGKHGLRAAALNSAESAGAYAEVLAQTEQRQLDYLFLSPEQLADADVQRALATFRPRLIAVDEAHLVSQWGPDFRPDYLRIAGAVEVVGRPVVVALTATASPPVREDIVAKLDLRDPLVYVYGFDRPNIHLAVNATFSRDVDKLEALAHDVPHTVRGGRGIVYAATRRGVEGLVADWNSRGLRAEAYHAGLAKSARVRVEEQFREGDLDVVVATVAFGMGIDQPDIRWVFHADIPPSIDGYYQEIGRAGRDGQSAEAVLYFRPDDLRIPRLFAASSGPSWDTIVAVASALPAGRSTVARIAAGAGISRRRVESALAAMRDAGVVRIGDRGAISVVADPEAGLRAVQDAVARRRAVERSRAEAMEAYAEHRACRRQFILEYFGEPAPEPCGNCDNCERTRRPASGGDEELPFPRGSTVVHATFGSGEVLGYAAGRMMVSFEDAGYKRLDVALVVEGELLRLVPTDSGPEAASGTKGDNSDQSDRRVPEIDRPVEEHDRS